MKMIVKSEDELENKKEKKKEENMKKKEKYININK